MEGSTSHTVYLLGAGFSVAATEGRAPLMRGYFRGLNSCDFPNLYKFVKENFGDVENAELQEVIGDLDQCEDLPYSFLCKDSQLPHIHHELADFTMDRLAALEWKRDNWAARLLADALQETATIITTNYDTLAEEIMSSIEGVTHCGNSATCFHCRMMNLLDRCQQCDVDGLDGDMWRKNILKLHGSIAWHTCRSKTCKNHLRTWTNCDLAATKNAKCPSCSSQTVSVLIHPRMKKPYGDFQILQTVWQASSIALSHATQLVIFGFSLPETDAAIRRLLRTSLNSQKLKEVIVISREPSDVSRRIQTLLPWTKSISFAEFVAPNFGEWPVYRKQDG